MLATLTDTFRVGYFPKGDCWRWRLSLDRYYRGRMLWFSFWRFYLVIDRS